MIEQTVEDLTTIIGNQAGLSRVGRVASNDLPPAPDHPRHGRHGRGRRRRGRSRSTKRRSVARAPAHFSSTGRSSATIAIRFACAAIAAPIVTEPGRLLVHRLLARSVARCRGRRPRCRASDRARAVRRGGWLSQAARSSCRQQMARRTRRTFSTQQKLEIVMQLMRGEKQLTALAREHGRRSHDDRRQASAARRRRRRGSASERALGRKTSEVEILGEASRQLG